MDAVIAALVSAVVSVAVTLWLRRADKPKADWIFARLGIPMTSALALYLRTERGGKEPDFLVMVTNAGDGVAYQLEVEGLEADVTLFIKDGGDTRGFRVPAKLPLVAPGEEVGVLIWFHPVHEKTNVGFRMKWLQAPVRQLRYVEREVLLSDPEPQLRRNQLPARLWRQFQARAKRAWAQIRRQPEQL